MIRTLTAHAGLALAASAAADAAPLAVGETFTLDSAHLGETRRVNVYLPPGHDDDPDRACPVLVMPDGGLGEDFLHVAGLVQVSVANGTMRPFILVGVENTERRRDLTGPTADPRDREIAPRTGGSAAFRAFLRDELLPAVRERWPTTDETAIVGESLAGLFVVETLFAEPDLFDTYLAFDPSLWWNREALVAGADAALAAWAGGPKRLFLASSGQPELADLAARLAAAIAAHAEAGVTVHLDRLPDETHATIYHPAALRAFRAAFPPAPGREGD